MELEGGYANKQHKINDLLKESEKSIPSLIFASETEILEGKIQASEPSSSAPDQFSGVFPTIQKLINLM